jgi:hypothetical protein
VCVCGCDVRVNESYRGDGTSPAAAAGNMTNTRALFAGMIYRRYGALISRTHARSQHAEQIYTVCGREEILDLGKTLEGARRGCWVVPIHVHLIRVRDRVQMMRVMGGNDGRRTPVPKTFLGLGCVGFRIKSRTM